MFTQHDKSFFRRFKPDNRVELIQQIDAERNALAAAQSRGDQTAALASGNRLGFLLYVTGSEAQAKPVLETALQLAQHLQDRRAEVEILLSLATTLQYLHQPERAQVLFQQTLDYAVEESFSEFEHVIEHHRGRCYAEQSNFAAARLCFERALFLRRQLGDEARIASTQAALAELDELAAHS